MDIRIVPWLGLLYLLNFLDRGAIGNAKLYGLEADLNITHKQYLIALTVFFFPYAVFERVSNVLLRRHLIGQNLSFLSASRFFLGLAEAGLYPGIVFYISWQVVSIAGTNSHELGTRVALFFTSATIAGAFSGLLAAAISNMNGIFILEGLFTILCAIASFWVIQDFPEPETAKFLTSAERRVFVIRRLRADMQFSAGGEEFKMKCKTYIASEFDGPLFAFSLFTPTIINQVGIGTRLLQRICYQYLYVWSCIVTVFIGFLGDRLGKRGYINLALFSTGLVGYIILISSTNPALSYFLAASAWVSSNVEGSYKRGMTLAMAIGWGNINGAVPANVYRAQDAPWFRLGHGIMLAYIAIGWISSAIFMVQLKLENDRRERGERDEVTTRRKS
ncbi:MFS general substrate transporter [Imleria badia]|nr:MFS general substrate transporter [Imleria badia]